MLYTTDRWHALCYHGISVDITPTSLELEWTQQRAMRQQVGRRCFLVRFPTASLIQAVLCLQPPRLYPYQVVCELHWILHPVAYWRWHSASSVGLAFLVHVAAPELFSWSFCDWSLINSSSMAFLSSGTMLYFRNAAVIIAGCIVFSCIILKTTGNLPLETQSSPLVIFSWFIVSLISDRIFLKYPTSQGYEMYVNGKMILYCCLHKVSVNMCCRAILDEQNWS